VNRRFVTLAAAAALALAAGCSGTSGGGSGGGGGRPALGDPNDRTPVTIAFWHGFSDAREQGILKQALDQFHSSHPWITVKAVGAVDDDKIVKAIRGGTAPDVALSFTADRLGAYCSSGAWIDLKPYLERDKVDVNIFPKAVQSYTEFKGTRCAMPALSDVYGLYYNTELLKKAGYSSPPKTASELMNMALKMTEYNPDGSIKVLGFDPTWAFYEMVPAHVAPAWGAQWMEGSGKSSVGKDPHWAAMVQWQKKFVDAIGLDKLKRFGGDAGSTEFSANNLFETGKLAMNIDGEWRVAFVRSEHPELKFGTAPFPVDDSQPNLYGAGYVTGNSVGIPKTSKHREAAWALVKFLSTDTGALVTLSNGLRNVPTTLESLDSPKLTPDPQFDTFLKIFANPNTTSTPPTAAGSQNQELLATYLEKYQAGKGGDLAAGLSNVDKQIDDAVARGEKQGPP
jgi:multiple sugar transport system substrate-binding protein